jgi:hypothetical protein
MAFNLQQMGPTWAIYMAIFLAIGAAIGVVSGELNRYEVPDGMPNLGTALMAALLVFWGASIILWLLVARRQQSVGGIVWTLVVFVPGIFITTTIAFLLAPRWASWRGPARHL